MTEQIDSRLLHGLDKDIVEQRSRHDHLIIEEVRAGNKSIPVRPRVASDARLRDGLTAEQELAYDSIAAAYSMIVAGLGQHATDYSASRGRSLSGDGYGAAVMASYWEWRDVCRERHASANMAVDIIVFGITLRQCDAKHKMATGTARKNLDKCLNLWSELHGRDRIIPDSEKTFFAKMKEKYFK
jgi:hypothetical protein